MKHLRRGSTMGIFRRPVLVAAACTTALAAAFGVSTPASAAGGVTITPGGGFTATSTNWSLADSGSGNQFRCSSMSLQGQLDVGTVPGPSVGSIASTVTSGCATAVPTGQNLPWGIDITSCGTATGTCTGTITGVRFHFGGLGCTFDIAGSSATTGGTVDFTYSNSAHVLTLLGTGNLHAYNASGSCLGLVSSGDSVAFRGSFVFQPAQVFSPAGTAI